jgi:hypothetical protein
MPYQFRLSSVCLEEELFVDTVRIQGSPHLHQSVTKMLSRAVSCPQLHSKMAEWTTLKEYSKPTPARIHPSLGCHSSHLNQVPGKPPSRPLECNGRAWVPEQDSPPLASTPNKHSSHIPIPTFSCPVKGGKPVRLVRRPSLRNSTPKEEQRNIAAHRAINLPRGIPRQGSKR